LVDRCATRSSGSLLAAALCVLALLGAASFDSLLAQDRGQKNEQKPRNVKEPPRDLRLPAVGSERVCLGCHGPEKDPAMVREGRTSSIEINGKRFANSVHGSHDVGCVKCHSELPHKFGLPLVKCGSCHEKEANVYSRSIHGKQLAAGDKLAPTCQECHGEHYIVPLRDPESPAAPLNISQMCTKCHAEGQPVQRAANLPNEQVQKRYTQNIHKDGLFKQGLVVTAVCTSCHTSHSVLPHSDPASSISRQNVVRTCMKCHGMIEVVHRKIVRGTLWEKEPHKVPVCVECHAPHEARKVLYDTQMANSDCLSCHGKKDLRAAKGGPSLFVRAEEFAASIHGRKVVACTQCHTGVTVTAERPCSTIEKKVDCSICHEAEVSNYSAGIHGRLHAKGDAKAPYCTDCHGTHETLEHATGADSPDSVKQMVHESPTFALKVPLLCARCHQRGGQAAVRYQGAVKDMVENYAESIHGKGLRESGLTVTATCADCHTPHRELPRSDPQSTVHPDNIAKVCGKCHQGIEEQYAESVHSRANNTEYKRLPGKPDLPGCSDCHSSHEITRADATGFNLAVMDQCGNCHKDVVETYLDTYHGKASRLGKANAAKCYDCHGAHDILALNNSRSRLSKGNIVATCAKCHPRAHPGFKGYLTHATHYDSKKYPALFFAFWGMTGLLVATFAFFGCHTLLWLPTSWRMRKHAKELLAGSDPNAKHVLRFTIRQRAMHLIMIISFFGLALTGMTLKFSYMAWARFIAWCIGGAAFAGYIHRVCAVAMFGLFAYHLWESFQLYKKSGKKPIDFLLGPDTIVPTLADVKEFIATFKWFLGRGPRPQYGRWTYWEKFDYFAVFWGIGIIGSTGLMLWFPELTTWILPGWVLNVATIIHSDEALLATGFIFTIHFFNTHFRPEKFPMDFVMLTGRVPLEEWKHERPREYEDRVATGKMEEILADPMPTVVTHVGKFFGILALAIGLSLVALILYAMLFGG
jgi:cytochrome b subunit of formate dehydrogenase